MASKVGHSCCYSSQHRCLLSVPSHSPSTAHVQLLRLDARCRMMLFGVQAATLGDPRRPQEVKKISSVNIPPVDDAFSQTILLVAMTCGVSGLILQVTPWFQKALHGNRSEQQE